MKTRTTYIVQIPESDSHLLHALAKKLGWAAKKQKPQHITRLDKAIMAAHEDDLFETHDIDILMKSLSE